MGEANKRIEKLIEMLESSDSGTRYEACEFLRVTSKITPEATIALKKTLNDPDKSVRDAAQRALAVQSPTIREFSKPDQAIIRMDSARCQVKPNGSIVIKKNTSLNWIAITLLALLGIVPIVVGLIQVFIGDRELKEFIEALINSALMSSVGIVLIVALIFSTVRTKSASINVISNTLKVKHRSAVTKIPFSSLSYITVHSGKGLLRETVIDISVVSNTQEVINIGKVSGSEEDAISRAEAIARFISDAINIPVHHK